MLKIFESREKKIDRIENKLSDLRSETLELFRRGGHPSPLKYVPEMKALKAQLKNLQKTNRLYSTHYEIGDSVLYSLGNYAIKGTIVGTIEEHFIGEYDGHTLDYNQFPLIPFEDRLVVVFDPADDVYGTLSSGKKDGSFLPWVGNEQWLVRQFVTHSIRGYIKERPKDIEKDISRLIFVENIQ